MDCRKINKSLIYKKWRLKNKEAIKKLSKKYRLTEKGKETKLRNVHKFRSTPEGMKLQYQWNNKWRVKNHDKVKQYRIISEHRRRFPLEKDKITIYQWDELKKKHGYACIHCKKCEPEIKLTQDHIIPLSKGGRNIIENIQPLCRSCNCKKSNKILLAEENI